jgi:hypothetical protein
MIIIRWPVRSKVAWPHRGLCRLGQTGGNGRAAVGEQEGGCRKFQVAFDEPQLFQANYCAGGHLDGR